MASQVDMKAAQRLKAEGEKRILINTMKGLTHAP